MNKFNQFFVGFRKGFKEFGENINLIVNTILLSIVYLLGAGGTHFIAKFANKHFLDVDLLKERESYWSDLKLKNKIPSPSSIPRLD